MREDGLRHPADAARPALRGDCIDTYDAFCLLGASRKWSEVGPQPIDVSEILSLAINGLGISDLDERMSFVRMIKQLDRVEMTFLQAKAAK